MAPATSSRTSRATPRRPRRRRTAAPWWTTSTTRSRTRRTWWTRSRRRSWARNSCSCPWTTPHTFPFFFLCTGLEVPGRAVVASTITAVYSTVFSIFIPKRRKHFGVAAVDDLSLDFTRLRNQGQRRNTQLEVEAATPDATNEDSVGLCTSDPSSRMHSCGEIASGNSKLDAICTT